MSEIGLINTQGTVTRRGADVHSEWEELVPAKLRELDESGRAETDGFSDLVVIQMSDPDAYRIGQQMVGFDRELRRSAQAVRKSAPVTMTRTLRPEDVPIEVRPRQPYGEPDEAKRSDYSSGLDRPVHPSDGSLRLVFARQGSCDLVFEAAGWVQTLLVSDPATAIANAAALTGLLTRLVHFPRWRRPNLVSSGPAEVLDVLGKINGKSNSSGPGAGVTIFEAADGAKVSTTRRVTYLRTYPDGTSEFFRVE